MSSSITAEPGVLDSSAVLALLFDEPGAEVVRTYLPTGSIGAANLAEVPTKLVDRGMPEHVATRTVEFLGLDLVPMTVAHARRAAELAR